MAQNYTLPPHPQAFAHQNYGGRAVSMPALNMHAGPPGLGMHQPRHVSGLAPPPGLSPLDAIAREFGVEAGLVEALAQRLRLSSLH
jgi:hypothetical protein